MKKLLFDIVLNDKFSANMKKIAGSSENSIRKINKSLTRTKPLSRNLDQLEKKLRKLEKKRKITFDTKALKKLGKEIRQTQREINGINKKSGFKPSASGGGVYINRKVTGCIN